MALNRTFITKQEVLRQVAPGSVTGSAKQSAGSPLLVLSLVTRQLAHERKSTSLYSIISGQNRESGKGLVPVFTPQGRGPFQELSGPFMSLVQGTENKFYTYA